MQIYVLNVCCRLSSNLVWSYITKRFINIAGYKLAGANNPIVRRTSSHSSTASNKSSPSSTASSPKTSRNNLSTVNTTTTAVAASTSVGNVDR